MQYMFGYNQTFLDHNHIHWLEHLIQPANDPKTFILSIPSIHPSGKKLAIEHPPLCPRDFDACPTDTTTVLMSSTIEDMANDRKVVVRHLY